MCFSAQLWLPLCHHKVVLDHSRCPAAAWKQRPSPAVREKWNTSEFQPDSVRQVQMIRISAQEEDNVNTSNWRLGHVTSILFGGKMSKPILFPNTSI